MGSLQGQQLPKQGIVLAIGDHRGIEHVVAMGVEADLIAQVRKPLCNRALGHAPTCPR